MTWNSADTCWSQSDHVYDNCLLFHCQCPSHLLVKGSEPCMQAVVGIQKPGDDNRVLVQITSQIVAGGPHAHTWCSEPQTEFDWGWWMSPKACFHKEITHFIPSNLSIYHRPDLINMWQGRGLVEVVRGPDNLSLICWRSTRVRTQTDTHGHARMCAHALSRISTHMLRLTELSRWRWY